MSANGKMEMMKVDPLRLIRPTLYYALLSTALLGCTTLATQHPAYNQPLPRATREAELNHVTTWTINGNMAIQHAQKSESASVNWAQSPTHYTISFLGPLGIGGATLSGTAAQVTLTEDNGQVRTANNPDALVLQTLHWKLPVTPLFYWIRGLAAPNLLSTETFDRFNHLTLLTQQGWQIRYLAYSGIQDIDLPARLLLTHEGVVVKIVITDWKIPAESLGIA